MLRTAVVSLLVVVSSVSFATPASDLLSVIQSMHGVYSSTRQSWEDTLPSGEIVKGGMTGEGAGDVWMGESDATSIRYIAAFANGTQPTRLSLDGADGVVLEQECQETFICSSTIHARVDGSAFEFKLDDIVFVDNSEYGREYCLQRLPYALRGRYRWEFDSKAREIRIVNWGSFTDIDGVEKFRKLTLQMPAR